MCFREEAFTRHRNDQVRRRPFRKNVNLFYPTGPREIPVNWTLAPKFSGEIPSRLQQDQCHTTNCDRCHFIRTSNGHTEGHQNKRANAFPHKTRPDSKSQSSDSALGGSGERLWNGRGGRIPLLPGEEAEILQDMIQPDDSASGVPPGEPYPDYSSIMSEKNRTEQGYNAELSNILKEFEGHLNAQDNTSQPSGSYKKYITVGDF